MGKTDTNTSTATILQADNSYLEKRCQEKFRELKLNSPEKMKDYIKSLFEKHEEQGDVLVDLYRLVLPDWDRIDKITYSPKVSKRFWRWICQLFIDFDTEHHPEVFKGGIWLSQGFSSDGKLSDWEISFKNANVTFAS
jgi:hypothetical protein